jgi:hypothetical protein
MDILLGTLAYCIKFGFTIFALCWGLKYVATFLFNFLTEELGKKPE